MLLKAHRLTKDQDFKKLAKNGRAFFSQYFTVKVMKNGLEASRFGIVISVKVNKKAVARNRLKRRLREILRLNIDKLEPGFDIMLISKKEAIELDYLSLQAEVLKLLGKARIYLEK